MFRADSAYMVGNSSGRFRRKGRRRVEATRETSTRRHLKLNRERHTTRERGPQSRRESNASELRLGRVTEGRFFESQRSHFDAHAPCRDALPPSDASSVRAFISFNPSPPSGARFADAPNRHRRRPTRDELRHIEHARAAMAHDTRKSATCPRASTPTTSHETGKVFEERIDYV
ncbi:MAG: hypothetical protein QOC61_1930 [Acidobacteriota bacterium]|jgi:hypothetical protein|nr:hypothetical protein [Acidobacteriota bacterium]